MHAQQIWENLAFEIRISFIDHRSRRGEPRVQPSAHIQDINFPSFLPKSLQTHCDSYLLENTDAMLSIVEYATHYELHEKSRYEKPSAVKYKNMLMMLRIICPLRRRGEGFRLVL